MRSKKARFKAVAAICVGATLFAPAPRTRGAEGEVQCEDVASLSITDTYLAAESLDCIFDRGRGALPDLVQELYNEAAYRGGWCGYGSFSSESITVELDAPPPKSRKHMVAEAALYVIESILRESRYFARFCRVYLDGEESLDLPEVQSRIRRVADALGRLEPSDQRALSLDDFRFLMEEHALSFPGTR